MGNFYVNFSVKTTEPRQVADVLERAGRRAIVTGSRGGYVVAYDEEADTQAIEPIMSGGRLLSREMGCPVLAILNHDDDILCYWLFEGGELADSYNSDPEAFEAEPCSPPWQAGDAETLCATLGRRASAAAVGAILRGDHAFAVYRHQQLAEALGLPSFSVGFGYHYAANGELANEPDAGSLIYVGGRPT